MNQVVIGVINVTLLGALFLMLLAYLHPTKSIHRAVVAESATSTLSEITTDESSVSEQAAAVTATTTDVETSVSASSSEETVELPAATSSNTTLESRSGTSSSDTTVVFDGATSSSDIALTATSTATSSQDVISSDVIESVVVPDVEIIPVQKEVRIETVLDDYVDPRQRLTIELLLNEPNPCQSGRLSKKYKNPGECIRAKRE